MDLMLIMIQQILSNIELINYMRSFHALMKVCRVKLLLSKGAFGRRYSPTNCISDQNILCNMLKSAAYRFHDIVTLALSTCINSAWGWEGGGRWLVDPPPHIAVINYRDLKLGMDNIKSFFYRITPKSGHHDFHIC